jgi:hypothetical protein
MGASSEAPIDIASEVGSPMVNKLLQLLAIRCSHKKLSQPFAASVAAGPRAVNSAWDAPSPSARHYVVCLDCGRKFDYDWSKMRVVNSR